MFQLVQYHVQIQIPFDLRNGSVKHCKVLKWDYKGTSYKNIMSSSNVNVNDNMKKILDSKVPTDPVPCTETTPS